MSWPVLFLLLLVPESLSLPPALSKNPNIASGSADGSAAAFTSGDPPPPPRSGTARVTAEPPDVSVVSPVTHGDTDTVVSELTPAADPAHTSVSGPRAERPAASELLEKRLRSLGSTTIAEPEAAKSEGSLSPVQAMPGTEISPREKGPESSVPNDPAVQRSGPIDVRARLDNGLPISSTSVASESLPSAQWVRDPTQDTSTAATRSYFKRSTQTSQNVETGSSTTTPQLSNIREALTTKLPSSETRSTDTQTQSGTEDSTSSTNSNAVVLTTLSSARPVLPPPPDHTPSSTASPRVTTTAVPTASALQTQTPPKALPPSYSHPIPSPGLIHPPSSPVSSPSPVQHLPFPKPSSLPAVSRDEETSSVATSGEESTSFPATFPGPVTDSLAISQETDPSSPAISLETAPSVPSSSPEAVSPTDAPTRKPMSDSAAHPDVSCTPGPGPEVQRWRPGTDIQINFPLTIPGECTPAQQCSVTTVLDQRVTVQTSDTVTVRFEVSARGGAAPAAASLALRRADPGTTDCPIDHGAAPPALLVSANQRRRLDSDLLRPGVNTFLGRISLASEECFRLVVTVRAADCGDQQLCGGRGYCVARPDQEAFTCSCCSEWSGPYCEVSDPCSKRPCAEGATCVSDGSDYKCFCAEGTTGSNCSRPSDTCGTCLNGGTCAPDGVTCLCPRGYTGDGCGETAAAGETTPCDPSPCLRGECQVEGDAAVCVCPPGYRGQFCETHDVCSSAPCRYGGTCHPLGDGTGFNCSCATGFRGSVCQFRVLPLCTVHPCSNGGTCWDEGATYYCTCQHGFSGKHCEVPPGLIGHFDIHHMRSGVPIMASLSIGLFLVIAVVGCCYCRSVGGRQSLSRLCRPVSKCRSAARCCPRRTYKQFSEDQRKNLLEMGYSHSHQPIVEPIFADVDCSEAAEMPLIT